LNCSFGSAYTYCGAPYAVFAYLESVNREDAMPYVDPTANPSLCRIWKDPGYTC